MQRFDFQNEVHSETNRQTRLLASHNQQLQTSLYDIAQIVLDDADKDQTDSSVLIKSAVKPLMRNTG